MISELGGKLYKFVEWFGITYAFTKARMYFNKLFTTVYQLDDALVDLKKTFKGSIDELNIFYFESNKLAKQMGVTTAEIIKQGAAFSRLGYSSNETMKKMAEMSAMFAAISPDMDTETAQNGLVSIMKAFKIDPENVLDGILSKVNIIGNTAATSNGEIVEMLQKSSAAMKESRNSLEETIALETAAVEITRDAPGTGTAWKTIAARLHALDEETLQVTEDVEELTGKFADATKTNKTPGGISLFSDADKTTFKSTYQIFKELNEIWDDLNDRQKSQIEDLVGGKRQFQVVAAAISNFEAAEKALKNMANSAGNAQAEMDVIRESAAYAFNELKETFTSIAQNSVGRDELKNLINLGTSLLEIIDNIVKSIGSIPALLGTIFGIAATKTKSLFGYNKTTEKFSLFGADLGKGWFSNFRANRAEIKATANIVNELKTSFDGTAISQEMMNKVTASSSVALKSLVNDFNTGKISSAEFTAGLNGMSSSLQTAEMRLIAFKTGIKSLGVAIANIAISMAAVWAVNAVISLIVKGIDELIHHEDRIKESAKEAKNAIVDLKNELDNLKSSTKDISKEFAELAQGVENLGKANQSRGKLSTEDYEKFLGLSNQLAELYPTLTKGYDENGNAILNLSGNVNTIIHSLENLLVIQQKIANQSIVEKIPDVWAGYKVDLDKQIKTFENYEATINSYLNTLETVSSAGKKFTVTDVYMHSKLIAAAQNIGLDNGKIFGNSLSALYSEHRDIYGQGVSPFKSADWDLSSLSDEKIEQLKNELGKLASRYQDLVNSTKNKIESANAEMSSYINAWLSTEWNFVKLEKPMQEALQEVLLSGEWAKHLPKNINSDSWDEVSNWLSQNFLYAARNIDSSDTKNAIKEAVKGTLSVDALQELIDELKETEGFDKDNPLLIYLQTKLDLKVDLIEGVKARLKDEYKNKVVELSDEDLQIAANLQIPYDTLLSWDELLKKIKNFKDGKREIKDFTSVLDDLAETIDDTVKKQKKLADFFKQISSGAKLAAEDVYELMKEFPNIYKYLDYANGKYTVTSEGIKAMNQDATAKLQEKLKKDIDDKLADINEIKSLYEMAQKLDRDIYANQDDLKEYQDLYERTQSLRDKYGITSSDDLKNGLLDYDTANQFEAAIAQLQDELDGFKALADIAGEVFDEKALAIAGIQEGFNTAKDEISDYNKNIQTIDSAIKTLTEDAALSYDEMNELVSLDHELKFEQYPDTGKYTISISALEELKKKSYETRNSYFEDRIAETEAEMKAAQTTKKDLQEKMKLFDEYGEFVAKALSGFESKEAIQKQIDIAVAQSEELAKVVEMLKALSKDLTFDTGSSSNNALQNQIDYYNTIIDAVKAVKDQYTDVLDKEKDALEESKDALKEANDERQRELDLIEARNNLENAKKRKVYVYTEGEGFKQVQDKAAVKEAEEKYRDVITDIQEAEIDKAIDEIDKKKEALENIVKDLVEAGQNIQDAMAISKAMQAYGLTDPKELLTLSDSIKNDIIGGLADAELKKDIEENKDNTKYIAVTLDDVLAELGSTKRVADLSSDVFNNIEQAARKSAVDSFVEASKNMTDNMINNTTNINNPNITNNNNFVINDATDPQKVGEVISDYMQDLLIKYNNSLI